MLPKIYAIFRLLRMLTDYIEIILDFFCRHVMYLLPSFNVHRELMAIRIMALF
jgi:hypothetical protein